MFANLESSERYFRVRGSNGGDLHVFHEFDVALCGITVENAACSLLPVGYPCSITLFQCISETPTLRTN